MIMFRYTHIICNSSQGSFAYHRNDAYTKSLSFIMTLSFFFASENHYAFALCSAEIGERRT
jgi:hypothetical protein